MPRSSWKYVIFQKYNSELINNTKNQIQPLFYTYFILHMSYILYTDNWKWNLRSSFIMPITIYRSGGYKGRNDFVNFEEHIYEKLLFGNCSQRWWMENASSFRFSLFRRMRSQAETRQAPVSAGKRREKEEDAKEGRRKRKIEGRG